EALAAYEQALVLEERADAALAAGELYRRAGQAAEAAARFARAYAAGGGAEALWRNAQALFQAGDERAAEQALTLWSTLVPRGRGLGRLEDDGLRREGREQVHAQMDERHQRHAADAEHGGVAGARARVHDGAAQQQVAYIKEKERSEEHTSELQSPDHLVCRLLLEKKKDRTNNERADSTETKR